MIAIDHDTISFNPLEPPTGLITIFFPIAIIKYHWTLQLSTCKLAVLQQVAYLMIAQQAMVTVAGGKSWKDRAPLLSHAAATGVSLQSVHSAVHGTLCKCLHVHCRWLAAADDVPAPRPKSSEVLQNVAEQRLPQRSHQDLLCQQWTVAW